MLWIHHPCVREQIIGPIAVQKKLTGWKVFCFFFISKTLPAFYFFSSCHPAQTNTLEGFIGSFNKVHVIESWMYWDWDVSIRSNLFFPPSIKPLQTRLPSIIASGKHQRLGTDHSFIRRTNTNIYTANYHFINPSSFSSGVVLKSCGARSSFLPTIAAIRSVLFPFLKKEAAIKESLCFVLGFFVYL